MVEWPGFVYLVRDTEYNDMIETGIQTINDMPSEEAQGAFEECCGSIRWAASMTRERPFLEANDLHHSADRLWGRARDEDRLEAFSAHPKIGDIDSLRKKFNRSDWALGEQDGTASASEETLNALADGNSAYEDRFGYIFIICATGKSADEMRQELERRLENDPSVEMNEASEQQRQIMHLRLTKMLTEMGVNERPFR